MLKLLRNKERLKAIIWIIAVLIIISFGFLGTAYLLIGSGSAITHAGKIFGRKVSFNQFDRTYQHVRIQSLLRYGDKFREMQPYLNLEEDTWNRLILLYEAQKRKIKISDEEVVQAIESYPFFQKDNLFNKDLYRDILQFVFRAKPSDFEESIRDNLKLNKIFEEVTAGTQIAEEDVLSVYKSENEKVQVSYVLISAESFQAEVAAGEEKVKEYYEANRLDFLEPPSINVEYLPLAFPPEAQEQDKLALRQRAQDYYQRLQKDPQWQTLAQSENLKIETTGFFSMEQPNLTLGWSFDLLNKAFQMKVDEMSEPIETLKGFYIIRVKEQRDTYIPAFDEIKEKVRQAFFFKEAEKVSRQKAEEYRLTLIEEYNKTMVKDFPQIAKNLGLEIHQTPLFKRGQYLPEIGISADFQEAAFALSQDNPMSEVIQTAKGFCILHQDAYEGIDPEVYAKEKEEVTNVLLLKKRNEVFNEFLSQLRLKANLVDNIAKLRQQQQAQP